MVISLRKWKWYDGEDELELTDEYVRPLFFTSFLYKELILRKCEDLGAYLLSGLAVVTATPIFLVTDLLFLPYKLLSTIKIRYEV